MAMQLRSPPPASTSSSSSSSSYCASCSKPSFTLFSPHHSRRNSNKPKKKTTLRSGQASAVLMDRSVKSPPGRKIVLAEKGSSSSSEAGVLVVRRPKIEGDGGRIDDDEKRERKERKRKPSAIIDERLEELAKKMPIFEPRRVGEDPAVELEKPLAVNLDLALHKAKVSTRNFKYQEAEAILQKCISRWPEDGRAYVALAKVLKKQSKTEDARAVYEKGCQATQGENPYIWQCWGVLENRMGNTRKARELFDAATVADKKHTAAWHGWAILELKQGNVKKARRLLAKAIRFCGGNEYVYQTLALLEARANRTDQARYLFRQATRSNPNSCASWVAWALMEMQVENNLVARKLFEKAVQASPKNRFAWQAWGTFEANIGNVEKGRKLLKIGHALNPKDPVILQSLALIEYKHSSANLARVLFRRASELDPRHQPVWIAWGWMEWKEGNISTARTLYQRALSVNTTTESAARCLQAWGVLEQRAGNISAARRLFRSSLSINSESYVTWMTWAKLEEDQGNAIRAEEIRDLYFQQVSCALSDTASLTKCEKYVNFSNIFNKITRIPLLISQRIEVVDDSSWVTGFFNIIDPALDSIKRILNLDQNLYNKEPESTTSGANENNSNDGGSVGRTYPDDENSLNIDSFIKERLSLDPAKLDAVLEDSRSRFTQNLTSPRRIWRADQRSAPKATLLSEPIS
ncbi:Protein high chlorophyll fluorescent 107 [Linum perenne]